jgi:hypothetical protein
VILIQLIDYAQIGFAILFSFLAHQVNLNLAKAAKKAVKKRKQITNTGPVEAITVQSAEPVRYDVEMTVHSYPTVTDSPPTRYETTHASPDDDGNLEQQHEVTSNGNAEESNPFDEHMQHSPDDHNSDNRSVVSNPFDQVERTLETELEYVPASAVYSLDNHHNNHLSAEPAAAMIADPIPPHTPPSFQISQVQYASPTSPYADDTNHLHPDRSVEDDIKTASDITQRGDRNREVTSGNESISPEEERTLESLRNLEKKLYKKNRKWKNRIIICIAIVCKYHCIHCYY